MPPKAKKDAPGKKTVEKQKAKVIEDKTFGLKNKKGNKQQKFIQHVQKTVSTAGKSTRELEKEQNDKLKKKEDKKKQQDELNSLFRPVEQKVGKGADPKSVLCAFFKAGSCGKGDKCKFSHDLNVARKGEKRGVYDSAEKEGEGEDNMENWDEAKLEDVINKKHGESNKKKMETKIVCKFFLDAVENSKYGWFWACPNGEACHYKHALPPGFELKKDAKKEDKTEKISLEELIEKERAALNSQNLTKVTLESFMKWKNQKKREKIKAFKKVKDEKKKDFKAGKNLAVSGRELFEFNPDLVADEMDDEEGGGDVDLSQFKQESDDEDDTQKKVNVKEIDLEDLAAAATEADESGSKRGEAPPPGSSSRQPHGLVNGELTEKPPKDHNESNKLSMAAGGAPPSDGPGQGVDDAIAAANSAIATDFTDVPIDEDLFEGDDILDVDAELDTLDLAD